jgi:hypothetical protein
VRIVEPVEVIEFQKKIRGHGAIPAIFPSMVICPRVVDVRGGSISIAPAEATVALTMLPRM